MKISYNWLKQYVDFTLTPEDVSEILTNTGLEVEEFETWESVKGGLKGVVIGEIKECVQHPDADKLKVTKVDIGTGELLQIVCGAPNCRVGLKSPIATIGANLYPVNAEEVFAIKKSKIRGVESFGMICAEDELGLGESHSGIMELPLDTPIGLSAAEYFNVESDIVYTIGLTPNRSDGFSHIGVARDLRAALRGVYNVGLDLKLPTPDVAQKFSSPIAVKIENTKACKRYSALYIKNIKVQESPLWLQNRLKAIGVKPINNIVDVTNFVLHEMGQPLHAFDAAKIGGGQVIVRNCNAGTPFVTLDGVERKLDAEDLMICDAQQALCIAGVYGGLDSGVSDTTTDVFLESAFFDPISVRKTATRHALRTDASQHFEKTTDVNATSVAALRAAALIVELGGGEVSEMVDVYPDSVANAVVETSFARINELAGTNLPQEKVEAILNDLGFVIQPMSGGVVHLTVPTYRVEVKREADVVEEILRIYGYNTVPMPKRLHASLSFSPAIDYLKMENKAADYLVGAGYFEASTNSITQSKFEQDKALQEQTVRLLNSQTTELDALRTSMVYGLLEVVSRNINYKNQDIQFFEFGNTYHKTSEGYSQQRHLTLLLSGKTREQNWISKAEKFTFFHLKTDVLNLLNRFMGGYVTTSFENESVFEFGLKIIVEGQLAGTIGKLKSNICQQQDVKQEVFFADINWSVVLERSAFQQVRFTELSKYPAVQRDLSMIVEDALAFEKIEQLSFAENKKLLRSVSLFDVYKGEKIEAGKKSYAVSFTFLDETKTLTDKDIDKVMNRLMDKFEKEIGAQIRRG